MSCVLLITSIITTVLGGDRIDASCLKSKFSYTIDARYQIIIAIDFPGTCSKRTLIVNHHGVDAGHCALQFVEAGSDTLTSVTVGYYPKNGINPFNSLRNRLSELRDDSHRDFEFRASIDVTRDQFDRAIDVIKRAGSAKFNLYDFNCVDFCNAVLLEIFPVEVNNDHFLGRPLRTPSQLRQALLNTNLIHSQRGQVLEDCQSNRTVIYRKK